MYSREEKLKAVELFIKYDKSPASAIRELGYPSQELLGAWIDELEPGRRPKRSSARRFSHEAKEQAVVALVARRGAAKIIADGLGIERATLYNWKRKLLSEKAPCKLPRKID